MKKHLLVFLCIVTLLMTGCGASSGPGPRAWIDAPLDGSTLPLEPVVVRSHAASASGTTSATLYVNGAQVRVDNVADTSAQLVEITQVWQPDVPGEYSLQVVAVDASGDEGRSASVHIRIGEVEPSEVAPPATQPPIAEDPPETGVPTDTPGVQAPSVPTFTFTTNANCRAGPGTAYEVDDSFLQGQSARIEGRNQGEPRWWWVQGAHGGHCWVSDATGTVSGPAEGVQVVAAPPPPVVVPPTDTSVPPPQPPPPPQPTAPAAPGGLSVTNHICASPTYSVTLGWQDQANNEQGYRVYRDNTLIATLGANSTSYTDLPPGSGPYTYQVEAFNNVGAASAITSDPGCIF